MNSLLRHSCRLRLAPTVSEDGLRHGRVGAQVLTATYVLPAGAWQALRGVFRYAGSADPCPGGVFDDVDDLVFATR